MINVNEFSIVLFYKRRSHYQVNLSLIKVLRTNINWTNQAIYLGVTLDSKMTYKYHISNSCVQQTTD